MNSLPKFSNGGASLRGNTASASRKNDGGLKRPRPSVAPSTQPSNTPSYLEAAPHKAVAGTAHQGRASSRGAGSSRQRARAHRRVHPAESCDAQSQSDQAQDKPYIPSARTKLHVAYGLLQRQHKAHTCTCEWHRQTHNSKHFRKSQSDQRKVRALQAISK